MVSKNNELVLEFVEHLRIIQDEFASTNSKINRRALLARLLAKHLFQEVLDWTPIEGQGHFLVEGDRVLVFDNEYKLVIEAITLDPEVSISTEDLRKECIDDSAKIHRLLTNGRKMLLYLCVDEKTLKLVKIDIDQFIKRESNICMAEIREFANLARARFRCLEDTTKYC